MNLNEEEKRMVFQIESTTQNAALKKLRPLSGKECMDVIREIQTNYHLPDKARTIGEMLAEAAGRR